MDDPDVRGCRSVMAKRIVSALPVAVGVYPAVLSLAHMADPVVRLVFALNCRCVAILLSFTTGIEALAHERRQSPALDRCPVMINLR
jgi:hypothetical protein